MVIVFLFPVMLLMIALVVNINYLIFTKIKLQNTVDACALSAAAVQAAGLNEIADLNFEMTLEHSRISQFLSSGTWYNRLQAENAGSFFYNSGGLPRGVIDWIQRYQQEANISYAQWAEIVAQDVKNKNFPQSTLNKRHDSSILTGLRWIPEIIHFQYYFASCTQCIPVSTLAWFNPGDPRFAGSHDGRLRIPAKRTAPLPDLFFIPERAEKIGATYVDYEIVLPAHDFALGGNIFSQVPELKARAAARPAGGHIRNLQPNYMAVLIK